MTKSNPQTNIRIIEPSHGLVSLGFDEIYAYRELLFLLAWREIKVRYAQTILGALWIILQPLFSIVIFTVIFGILLQVPSGGAPYPLFALAALVPWNYFAGALGRSTNSLLISAQLVTKVYFPRLLIPIASVLAGLVDFAIAFALLLVLSFFFGLALKVELLLLPVLLLLAMATALGVGLWFSALSVRFRDINYLVPFVLQIWMYCTPVIYGSQLIPERFRLLIGLNPMTGVVEGFRWILLGSQFPEIQPPGPLVLVSVGVSLVILISGIIFFRYTERSFADII